jgi:hypothetical protein
MERGELFWKSRVNDKGLLAYLPTSWFRLHPLTKELLIELHATFQKRALRRNLTGNLQRLNQSVQQRRTLLKQSNHPQ